MRPDELLAILHTAAALKDTTRHCYTAQGRHESVAEHSWRLTLMAYFLRSQFPDLDMDKVTAAGRYRAGGQAAGPMGGGAAPALLHGDEGPLSRDGCTGDAGGPAV